MLIYVTVPPMVALVRERTRDVELPFFNDMTYDLKETFFRDAVRMYTELAETGASMSDVETVFINNASSYDDLTKEVVSVATTLRSVVLSSKDGHFSL